MSRVFVGSSIVNSFELGRFIHSIFVSVIKFHNHIKFLVRRRTTIGLPFPIDRLIFYGSIFKNISTRAIIIHGHFVISVASIIRQILLFCMFQIFIHRTKKSLIFGILEHIFAINIF